MINTYARALRALGHSVTTCSYSKNKYYPTEKYDIEYDFWLDYLLGRKTDFPPGEPLTFMDKVVLKLRNETGLFEKKIERDFIDPFDVFIFIWAGQTLMAKSKDLSIISGKGKKIISVLVGSDVRYASAFQQEFSIDTKEWPVHYRESYSHYNHILRNVEKYSDIILSVPDQMGLAIRPYDHFHLPIDLKRLQFQVHDRDVPIIVHAPSAPAIKGTDIILNTLQRLKDDGLNFKLVHIQNMSNAKLLELLKDADILVDELILHGPGVLSLEAMGSGCAVATRFLESSPSCFRPPIVSIDANNIYERVKELIVNKHLRKELAIAGRKYVEENNDANKIAIELINKLDEKAGPHSYDYTPRFFLDKFIPEGPLTITDKAYNEQILRQWIEHAGQSIPSLKERGLI